MTLLDRDIRQAIKDGDIVVDPFDEACLGPNSYDVHLAPELLTYRLTDHDGYAVPLDCARENPTRSYVIDSQRGVVLVPGTLFLASTVERTESHRHVPRINGKSSLGRLGLSVHVTAGEGDVGFCGTWTLELTVVHPLRVYAGMPVAQLLWSEPSSHRLPERPYDRRPGSKYVGQSGPTRSEMHRNFRK